MSPTSAKTSYRFEAWPIMGTLPASIPSEDLQTCQQSTPEAQSHYYSHASPGYDYDDHIRSVNSGSIARSTYDSADRGDLNLSPRLAQQQLLGDSWNGFGAYTSPSPSGSSYSSCEGRAFSEVPSVSWTSPGLSMCCSPSLNQARTSVDSNAMPRMDTLPAASCALSDVQHFPEADADILPFDSHADHAYGHVNVHSATYHAPQITVEQAEQLPPMYRFENQMVPITDYQYDRRESSQSDYTYTSTNSNHNERNRDRKDSTPRFVSPRFAPSKIGKRENPNRRRQSAPNRLVSAKSSPTVRHSRTSQSGSNFPCPLAPYGCSSSFGSKNEWKRHVNTQHLRLDMWRCDQCSQRESRPNDFNRKDLFIQHLRRMHLKATGNDAGSTGRIPKARNMSTDDADPEITEAERRCHIHLRSPPSHSCCLFCPEEFDGQGSWEERMEHIGKHLEHDKKESRTAPVAQDWRTDYTVQAWMESEGLIAKTEYGWRIADGRTGTR